MKTLLLLLAAAAGAGFLFHDRLQTWLHLARRGSVEVYYLRAAQHSINPDGTVVNWPLGQPLRTTTRATAAEGAVALTDGTNVLQVPRNVLTRDAGEAATLRQADLVSQNAAATQLADVQPSESYRSGPVATVNAAPVYYYPTTVVMVVSTPAPKPQVHHRIIVAPVPRPRVNEHPARPAPTPSH